MATSLVQAADNKQIEAINAMRPKGALQLVKVYVEGQEDIAFWAECLLPYTAKYNFEIDFLRDKEGNPLCGKSKLIETIGVNSLGSNLILAVDADYDWIIPNYRPSATSISHSNDICNNQYIVHTYLYSIENYKCHPDLVASYIVKTTGSLYLNETRKCFGDISEALADLFLLHLVSMSLVDGEYDIAAFRQDVALVNYDFQSMRIKDAALQRIASKRVALCHYEQAHPTEISDFANKLQSLGFDRRNYFLLFQGHTVADCITKGIARTSVWKLRRDRLAVLNKIPDIGQRTNRLREYCKLTGIDSKNNQANISERIEQLIHDCTDSSKAVLGFNRMKQDLDVLFS